MWQFTAIVVGSGGVGGRHNLGFICLAAGSPQPLGHSGASGRAAAVCQLRSCWGDGLGLWLFPKGPWRYLQPHLQGKVWPSGRRVGSAVGERPGLIPPPGELGFSLPGFEGPCLEGDSKPGTILMPPPPLASGGVLWLLLFLPGLYCLYYSTMRDCSKLCLRLWYFLGAA